MQFWDIFTQKMAITQKEITSSGKKFTLVLKTTYKKLVLKYWDNARFPSLCLAFENAFLSHFYSKNAHNAAENYYIRKKLELVLKTTEKLVLKYQGNARFLHCVWPLRMHFWAIFTQKLAITEQKIIALEKNLNLFWRLHCTCKKLVLKYQDNAMFPSLCLPS